MGSCENDPELSGEDRFVVGVTGHRDIRTDDIGKLEEAVGKIFTEINNKYPDVSITLLSPLAEGADRLVSKVALSLGISLVVPLPMPQEEYELDFTAPASINEFRYLLEKAASIFVVPFAEEGFISTDIRQHSPRSLRYAWAGWYIALHSNILIALWDGTWSGKFAGTSEIVRCKLEGMPEICDQKQTINKNKGRGPVYHIVTPHTSNPEPARKPFTIEILYP